MVWGTLSDRENSSSGGCGTSINLKQLLKQIEQKSSGGNCEGNDSVVWGNPSDIENVSSDGWVTSIHTKQVPNQIEHKSSDDNCEDHP